MRQPLDRVIVTCAVTGNLTTSEQAPHLPITPERLAGACLGAAEAGAAIVHIHVRDPGRGRPSTEGELSCGVLIPSNAAMVQKVRGIVEQLGGQVATAAKARAILGLPASAAGSTQVGACTA